MKNILSFLFFSFLISGHVFGQNPLTGAVLEFEASDRELASQASEVSILLSALLSQSEQIQLVERVSLQKILEEQEMGLAGLQDSQAASQVGKLLGAEVLITGRVFKVGDQLYLSAKTISTASGRVFGYTAKVDSEKQLIQGVEKLAEEINAGLKKNLEVLAPKTETLEEFLTGLEALVPKGNKPTVTISVKEEHLTREIIDPAVETELKKILLSLGYEVVVNGGDADLAITGEAFSEFAARFGKLVSCRARLELEIKDLKTGKLLLADRVTVANVDIAEHVAAKGALQKAARSVLPEVVKSLKN